MRTFPTPSKRTAALLVLTASALAVAGCQSTTAANADRKPAAHDADRAATSGGIVDSSVFRPTWVEDWR